MSPQDQEVFFAGAVKHNNLANAFWDVATDPDSMRGDHEQYTKKAFERAMAAVKKADESMGEADGPSCYESMHTALVPLNRILKQRDELASLCGEILSTIRLPSNDKALTEIGITYKKMLDKWLAEFRKWSGNANG